MTDSPMASQTRIATAPVSFGIFGSAASAHAPHDVVAAMVAAGYSGSELGPPGLFGSARQTAELFDEAGLQAVGAYVGIHFADAPEIYQNDLAQLRRTCDELSTVGDPAFVILADEGDELTRTAPARSNDHPTRWGDEQWQLASTRIARIVDDVTEMGLIASFHPHIGTYVENRREIETLLELTSIDLTLDTGHFLLAGLDPVHALEDFDSRINHVHIKDVRLAGLPAADVARHLDLDDWWGAISSPLGDGDVDLASFLDRARRRDFPWFVVEQDRDPAPPGSLNGISRIEHANRRWLEDAIARASDEVEQT